MGNDDLDVADTKYNLATLIKGQVRNLYHKCPSGEFVTCTASAHLATGAEQRRLAETCTGMRCSNRSQQVCS